MRDTDREPEGVGEVPAGKRPAGAHPSAHQLGERVGDGLHLGGHAGRDGDAEGVAKQGRVQHLGNVLAPADAHPHHSRAERLLQGTQGDGGVERELVDRHGPHDAQGVGELLGGLRTPHAAQRRVDLGDDVGIQQLAQLHGAEQLGQQRRVQRQRRRPLLSQGGVAFVHERAGVIEQQRGGEGAGLVGGHLGDAHPARVDVAHDFLQGGQVVDVLEALADRLQDDGKRRVVARHVQELLGALALLPQGRALARVAARQQQGAGGAFAEAGGEQSGVAHLLGDDVGDLVGVELEDRPVRFLFALRQAQHDAVVAGDRLGVHAGLLGDPPAGGQRPRGVDALAKRGVQNHAPIPQLVGEAFQHERLLVGQDAGGFLLFLEVLQQVAAGALVQAFIQRACCFSTKRTYSLAQLVGAAQPVAVPERQPAGVARRRGDLHLVAGDVLDAPAGGAEGEHVADAGFVDHLLVELADAPRSSAPFLIARDQEDAEHAAVRDGAGVGHRHPLRAGPRLEHRALKDGARAQLGEVGRRVDADDQVDHRVEHLAREVPVRPGAAHGVVPLVHVQIFHRDRGHGLLGQHVERAARGVQLFDETVAHAGHRHRRLHEVSAVLRVEGALRDRADGVASTAHALQAGGHRGRRFHLDDQVDRAHVDAQLQRGGGDHRAQRALLEHSLGLGALVLGHRAVVGARDHGGGVAGGVHGLHQLRRRAPRRRRQGLRVVLFGPQLVELTGQALGGAARVHEHDGGAVRHHLVVDGALDVRPDGSCRPRRRGRL